MFPHVHTSTPVPETVFSIIEDVIRMYPSNVAVDYEQKVRLSYSELGQMADHLALSLESIVEKGQLIPVVLHRSIEQIVAISALAGLGAVYVPLDIEAPRDRLESLLRRLQPSVVISTEAIAEQLRRWEVVEGAAFIVPETPKKFTKSDNDNHSCQRLLHSRNVQPDDLAAVLFTSGSTGEPKGVKLSNRNLIEPIRFLTEAEKITSSSRIFQFASCSFDVHLIDIFCALFNGSTLCQVSKDKMLSNLSFWINEMAGDTIHLTPSVISTFQPEEVPRLRYMVTCGEPVTKSIVETWGTKLSLWNLYGPCEASSIVSKLLTPDTDTSVVGKPTPHARLLLLDEQGDQVAIGVPGEIHCHGESVALGYLNDPDTTAAKFRQVDGTTLYATGDWGCIMPDGQLKLLGRHDAQVKVNGQRVDFSEIENVLSSSPRAIKFAVRAKKDENHQVRLYAFVSESDSHCGVTDSCYIMNDSAVGYKIVREIHTFCRSTLASYMVPRIIAVSAIPSNLSGKIDHQRLDRMLAEYLSPSEADIQNRPASGMKTEIERRVGVIVSDRLKHHFQQDDDDLILWGLTSLDTIMLIKELNKVFGVSPTVMEVLRTPTIRDIAAIIDARLMAEDYSSAASSTPPPFELSDRSFASSSFLSTSSSSGRLSRVSAYSDRGQANDQGNYESQPDPGSHWWAETSLGQDTIFAAQNLLQNHAYNCNFVLDLIDFSLGTDRFLAALERVCAMHETLRSTYHDISVMTDSLPQWPQANPALSCQQVHNISDLKPVFRKLDSSTLAEMQKGTEQTVRNFVLQQIEQNSKQLFNLESDSPVRVTLYEVAAGGNEWLVHFNIHHIAIDEWSFELLCRDLEVAYHDHQPEAGMPPENVVQYSTFARWQRLQYEAYREKHLNWWKSRIKATHCESLVSGMTLLPPETTTPCSESTIYIHDLQINHVQRFHAESCQGVTPFIGWLTLCQALLARVTNKADFLLGIPFTDRGAQAQFHDTVGFFLNTMAMPVSVDSDANFESLRGLTQKMYFDCIAHSAPYHEVIKALADESGGQLSPKIEVLFVYHDMRQQQQLEDEGVPSFLRNASSTVYLNTAGAQYDLVIHFDGNHRAGPHLRFESRKDVFSRSFVESLGRSFGTMLEDLVSSGTDKPLAQMQYVSTVDEQKVLGWSTTPISPTMREIWLESDGLLLHELVEQAVNRYGDTVALENISGQRLTYNDLWKKSQKLAYILQRKGLRPQAVGALLLDKSLAFVTSQLAILTVGAAIVCLDPSQKSSLNQSKIEVTKPTMVIVDSLSLSRVHDLHLNSDITVLNIDEIDLETEAEHAAAVCISRSDTAVICFTSGSTGNPKCFALPHSALAANIMNTREILDVQVGDRVSMMASVTFDVSILETYSSLASGATLCIASTDTFISSLEHVVNTLSITHLIGTPTVISTLSGPDEVPSLRSIVIGGETASAKLFNTWVLSRSVKVINAYGASECSITTHWRCFSADDDFKSSVQTIGQPVAGVRSYILDQKADLVLPGCAGLLYVGDRECGKLGQLSTGYIAPLSANERFIQHPRFGRIYNTGDLAFYGADGEYHLMGRKDTQVKIHGIRFELDDVENTINSLHLQKHVTIAAALELERAHAKSLVAFVHNLDWTSRAFVDGMGKRDWLLPLDLEITGFLQRLREEASAVLHNVMVPVYWIPLRIVPRNNNQKFDRNLLNQWFKELDSEGKIDLRPYMTLQENRQQVEDNRLSGSPLGRKLLGCWQAILDIPEAEIDVEQSFFNAGGDSISAIRFCSKTRTAGISGCTVSQLYKTPTLSLLLDTLGPLQHDHQKNELPLKAKAKPSNAPVVPQTGIVVESHTQRHSELLKNAGINADRVVKVYLVSSMQRSMLLQSMNLPGVYATQIILTFSGTFDRDMFQHAWNAVCQAHPSLRTTFVSAFDDASHHYEMFSVELQPHEDVAEIALDPMPSSDAFEAELRRDREVGFQLAGPMTRIKIYRETNDLHHVVLTGHHAIMDGWSLGILLKDLSETYQGKIIKPGPSFSQFVDGGRQGETQEQAAKDYWRNLLQGFTPFLFSSDDQSKTTPPEMKILTHHMPHVSAKQLSKVSTTFGVTPATIFQAALSLVLSKWHGEDDIAFGVTVSGRNIDVDGVTEAIGNFLNTIPLRVTIDSSLAIDIFLNQIYQTSKESMFHDHLALADILEQHAAKANLFDAVLVFENHATDANVAFGDNLDLVNIDGREYSELPLTVAVQHVNGGTEITFKFNASILSDEQAAAMLQSYTHIVDGLSSSAQPGEEHRVAEILEESDQYAEIETVKTAYREFKTQLLECEDVTLLSMFQDTVQKSPEAPALRTTVDGKSMTYAELDRQSDNLAVHLLGHGISAGEVVPILFEKSFEMIIAMFGVMKAGAAYCPVDINAPELRIMQQTQKVGAKVVLGQREYLNKISGPEHINIEDVCLDEVATTAILPQLSPSSNCYVLFTSGSTGQPKGCMLSHSAVTNVVKEASSAYGLSRSTKALLFANYTFDASVVDIYGCLASGATLYLSTSEELKTDLPGLVTGNEIDFIHLTPSVIQMLQPETCSTLKTIVSGGEKLPSTLRDQWAGRIKLINGWGPTECAVQVSATVIEPTAEPSVIQRPLPGNFMVVLNNHGAVARVGQMGQIYVGGRQVFAGYVNEPELTAGAFRNAPFDPELQLYATGDTGRYLEDMTIQLLGRKDGQVKVSGQRVEVEEIEAVLNTHGNVERSAVLVHEGRLHALIELKRGVQLEVESLREYCANSLPGALIPSIHVIPTGIPLTKSNKIDRRSVKQDFAEGKYTAVRRPTAGGPETPEEVFITATISKIVNEEINDVGLPLGEIGVGSLGFMQLRAILAQKYKTTLTYSELNNMKDIRSLAKMMARRPEFEEKQQITPVQRKSGLIPALDTQLTMWMAQERLQDNTYNVGRLVEFFRVDAPRLATALHNVVKELDIFRTTFEWNHTLSALQQRIHEDKTMTKIIMEDFSAYDQPSAKIQAICREDYRSVMDLKNGPLAVFKVFDCGSGRCFFYYNIHHILVDEWTCDMLMVSLSKTYHNSGQKQVFTTVADLSDVLSSTEYERNKKLATGKWRDKLDGTSTLDLSNWPKSAIEADKEGCTRGTVSKIIRSEVFGKLEQWSKNHRVTAFSTMLGLYQLLLHRYASSADFALLVPVTLRGHDVRTSNTLGNLTTTVFVRSHLTSDDKETLAVFIKRTNESVQFAVENAIVPLDTMLSIMKVAVPKELVMFTFNKQMATTEFADVRDHSLDVLHTSKSTFDFSMNVVAGSGGVTVLGEYDTEKFDGSFINSLVDGYVQLSEQLSQHVDNDTTCRLSELNSCSALETLQVRSFSNLDKPMDRALGMLLHSDFENQARATPDAIAIDFYDGEERKSVTYRELDEKAARIAWELQETYQITVGDIVPVYADQSPELVMAILGVLKAGAIYTPIASDGSWPAGRISYILEKCNVKIVLADVPSIPSVNANIMDVHDLSARDIGQLDYLATPDSIAYVMWTSGTTGNAKGCEVQHSAAAASISTSVRQLRMTRPEDRVLQFSSPVFDVSIEDIFTTLATGATLCMAPRRELLDDLEKVILALEPNKADLTPAVASLLDPKALSLELLIVGGDALTERVRNIWCSSSTTLVNAYGPAECAVTASSAMVNHSNDVRSIGKPRSSVQAVILDQWGNLAPLYAQGEILLGGPQLFRGYLGEPELTSAAFIEHDDFGRLYQTGDVGFFDKDGNIIFCGRRDSQVKLRGQRVELGGIAAAIEQSSPQVQDVVVLVIKEQLVAFISWADKERPQITDSADVEARLLRLEDLNARLPLDVVRTKLPAATVPSLWVEISHIPVTTSGKAALRVLQHLFDGLHINKVADGIYEAPENTSERAIHDCLCEVLEVPEVSMDANVFELGLDSFLAMALVSKVRKSFPALSLTLRDLLDHPIPRSLAEFAGRSTLDSEHAVATIALPSSSILDEYRDQIYTCPASSIQERFYLAQEVLKDASYNVPVLFEVKGLEIVTVLEAITAIFQANAIFRTSFSYENGLQQVISPEVNFEFPVDDLEALDWHSASDRMTKTCETEFLRPFDLSSLPLARCRGFKLPGGRQFLSINMHHAIHDEHSLRLLVRDILSRCTETVDGQLAKREPTDPAQYVDYSIEEQRLLAIDSVVDGAKEFWKTYLKDANSTTNGLIGAVASSSNETRLGTYQRRFSTSQNTIQWARKQGATPFSTFLTMFHILLSRRWSIQDPAVVIPVSQRPTDADMYGCFLNTAPVCTHIDGSAPLEAVIRDGASSLFRAMQNSVVPYEKILRMTGLGLDCFQTMFVYNEENVHETESDLNGLGLFPASDVVFNSSEALSPKFPITFSVNVIRKGDDSALTVSVAVEYDNSLVQEVNVVDLCLRYEMLLQSASRALEEAALPIGCLNILTSEEKFALEKRRDEQRFVDPAPLLVHQQIQQQVDNAPHRIACCFEGAETVTYGELWEKIIAACSQISQLRTHSDEKICLFMDAGIERIASIVGTVTAGFAYVPLSIENPASRNVAIIQDCTPRAVLVLATGDEKYNTALESLRQELEKHDAAPLVRSIVFDLADPADSESCLSLPDIDASDLAYVLYTSGSTGRPKGVQIEHRALQNSVREHQRIYQLDGQSRLLQFAPWTFDVSVADIFGTLSSGGMLCLGRKDYLVSRLQEAINSMEVTHIATTPTVIGLITPESVPSLKSLAIGGEPMTKAVRDSWATYARLLNVYGPTETCVNVVSCVMKLDTPVGIIGKPLRNVIAYILNDQLVEMPLGAVGQLAIGGPQVGRGYLNRPEENKAFADHPRFGKIYLTGDLAKFTSDGSILLLGRIDNQVKLRGQRIELGEIEDVIATDSRVCKAVVTLVSRDSADSLAVAYALNLQDTLPEAMETVPGKQELSNALREIVTSKLPPYAVPKYWIPISKIPSNVNGKIDRRTVHQFILSIPELSAFMPEIDHEASGSGTALSTKHEVIIGECIKKVLGVDQVFAESNFFALSGDSISAIRLCTLARNAGLHITVRDIYRCPTISVLAACAVSATVPVPAPVVVDTIVSRAHGQVYSTPIFDWFFTSGKHNPHWFNQSYVLKFKDEAAFRKMPEAWRAIVELHPTLRLRCSAVREDQHIVIEIPEESIGNDYRVEWQEVPSMAAMFDASLDLQSRLRLDSGPISAIGLFTVQLTEFYCVIAAHHLAIDIVSWRIIFDNLDKLLQGQEGSHELGTFRDWSARVEQRQRRLPVAPIENGISPGRRINEDLVASFTEKASMNTIGSTKVVDVNVSRELTDALAKANRIYGSETVDLLLGSLMAAFGTWSDREETELELCFESHGRDFEDESVDVSATVGWFTYMYPILFSVSQKMKPEHMIAHIKDSRFSASKEVDFARPLRRTAEHPLVTFNYLGSYSEGQSNKSFELVHVEEGRGDEDPENLRYAVFDIGCGISNGVLNLSIIYSTTLHQEQDVSRLLDLWRISLEGLIHSSEHNVIAQVLMPSEIPLVQMNVPQLVELVENSLVCHNIDVGMVEDILPATDMQTVMILASQEEKAYLESFTYEIEGHLEVQRFKNAWSAVIRKHSVLRTVFVTCDVPGHRLHNELLQVILKPEFVQAKFQSINREKPAVNEGQRLMSFSLKALGSDHFEFTWSIHHALTDGWSTAIILHDLEQAYLGALNPVAAQFKDAAVRIHELSRSPDAAEFWKAELEGVEATRVIDYSNSPEGPSLGNAPTHSRFERSLRYPVSKLATLAAERKTTVSTILRAAWALTLSWYTGEGDVVFGVTTSGRSIDVPGVEGIVGPCVNTVPFCVSIHEGKTRDQYLDFVQRKNNAVAANEFVSLRQIYKRTGNHELFDTVLLYQNYPNTEGDSSALPFTMKLKDAHEAVDIPLTLMVGQDDVGSLFASILLQGNRFSTRFLEGMVDSLAVALQWLGGTDGGMKLKVMDLLGPSQRDHIDGLIHGPTFPEEKDTTVWEMFREQIMRDPYHPALEFYSTTGVDVLSYQQLFEQAERAAAYLHSNGIRFGNKIALYLDKSVGMVVSMLAVLRLGAAYIPLDRGSPKDRLTTLLQESSPEAIIASADDASILIEYLVASPILTVEALLEPHPTAGLGPAPGREAQSDLAMVLFTSGTTGVPKGVCLPHRYAARYALCMAEAYHYDHTSRVFNFARYGFDVAITDIFGALSCGATVCLASLQDTLDDLPALLNTVRATHVNLTASVAAMLVEPDELPCLKCLVLAGEPATKALYQLWAPRVHVVNAYGPTEAAVITCADTTSSSDPRCVGTPVRGMDVLILDDLLRKVPFGCKGTLYASGGQMALGYLNRPDVTARSFVGNPYEPGALMYNTGDLGAYDSAGCIQHLGRKDTQVKLHGQRLELGEIENAMSGDHSAVVVMLLPSASNESQLVAFATASSSQPQPTSSSSSSRPTLVSFDKHDTLSERLLDKARRTLPSYMVPATMIFISSVPLTKNGKVDRTLLEELYHSEYLPSLSMSQNPEADGVVPPTTATERLLHEAIVSMCSLPVVSVDADLFAVALDSLSALRFAGKLRRELKVALSIQTVMAHRSIRELARELDRKLGAANTRPTAKPAAEADDSTGKEQGSKKEDEAEDEAHTFTIAPTLRFSPAVAQPGPDRPTLFCIHPASGLSFPFGHIAEYFPDVELVGINDPHFGEPGVYRDIVHMAEEYCEIITALQPSGPYLLVGYSFGGHVALEVARLLQHRTPNPSTKVVLVDCASPRPSRTGVTQTKIEGVVHSFGLADADADAAEERDLRRKLWREVERNLNLMEVHRPERYSGGAVCLLKAYDKEGEKEGRDGDADADADADICNGYDSVVEQLSVEAIYGDHYSVFTDKRYVEHNAGVLRRALGLGE